MAGFTKEEVIAGSKLIAEFMDYEYYPFDENRKELLPGWWKKGADRSKDRVQRMKSNNVFLARRHHELRYFNSFDAIHPVLSRMERHGCIIEMVYCMNYSCCIKHVGPRGSESKTFIEGTNGGDTPIQATWKVIVQYLEWRKIT